MQIGGKPMAVARGDEGPSNVARKRIIRKPAEGPGGGASPPPASRLDDLYRLPMPKLFNVAEREGLTEHTGMNRGQLIMAVVPHPIEPRATGGGSRTLALPPPGHGF